MRVLFSVPLVLTHVGGNVEYVLPNVLPDVLRLVISHVLSLALTTVPIIVFTLVQKNVEVVLIFAIPVSECALGFVL